MGDPTGVAVGLALVAGAVSLGVRNGTFSGDPFTLLSVLAVATYVGVGALLATRVPSNPIGWLLLSSGVAVLLGGFMDEYATYTLETSPGSLPLGTVAAWVNNWSILGVVAIPLVLVLFPTGRPPTRRWRAVAVGDRRLRASCSRSRRCSAPARST